MLPKLSEVKRGDVVFLERPVEGIEYPTGYYVLRSFLQDQVFLSLLSQDRRGLCPADKIYMIAASDLAAFTPTPEKVIMES